MLAGWEKTADSNYRDYKFDDAIKLYRMASDRTGFISDSQKKSEAFDRIQKKIGTTQSTGEGYVVNRTKSLVDQAEFYNFQDKIYDSKNVMEEARRLITGPMWIFVTAPALANFNNYAKMLKIGEIISDAERNKRQYDENKRRDEELASRRRADEEAEAQSMARKDLLSASYPFIRLGYGAFGLINLADPDLNKYYEEGQAFMFECDFLRFREPSGDGFDLFGRYMLRKFKMTDSTFEDFQTSPPPVDSGFIRDYPLSKSTLDMHSFDVGIRYSIGAYFLYERWDIYIGGAYRLLYASEKAESGLSNSFWSSGIIGNAGIEMTLTSYAGLFAEIQSGYTPVGKSKRNVEGSQALFGATLRLSPILLSGDSIN
jgi:hypothetical protein